MPLYMSSDDMVRDKKEKLLIDDVYEDGEVQGEGEEQGQGQGQGHTRIIRKNTKEDSAALSLFCDAPKVLKP